jgi:site-specific DNA-methyltransferase (adenine-specific)
MNKFYHGDCKFVLQNDIDPNSIDLIYLDPPFFTGKIQKGINKWNPSLMEVSYEDSKRFWGKDDKVEHMRKNAPLWLTYIAESRPDFASYLYYMMERIQLCHKVLKSTGSIYLHCDWRASHYLKMIMDEIFGHQHFQNEFIWYYSGGGASKDRWARKHASILFYSKSNKWTFNADKVRVNYKWDKGQKRADGSERNLEQGKLADDVWECHSIMPWDKDNTGYPTQKPLPLLKRIIEASSNKSDVVLDPFCGCGTTIIAANELGRQWVGIDISRDALDVTKGRERQMTLEQINSFNGAERICRDLNEISKLNPHDFEKWVNEFYKAAKPSPDRGIDGIKSNGTPIQTKAFEVKYDVLDKAITAAKLHPIVPKPIKEIIIVSQVGFDDSARKTQYQIETEFNIKVRLESPKEMLTI